MTAIVKTIVAPDNSDGNVSKTAKLMARLLHVVMQMTGEMVKSGFDAHHPPLSIETLYHDLQQFKSG